MLTFSVKTLWMAIYAIVGPNISQVAVLFVIKATVLYCLLLMWLGCLYRRRNVCHCWMEQSSYGNRVNGGEGRRLCCGQMTWFCSVVGRQLLCLGQATALLCDYIRFSLCLN